MAVPVHIWFYDDAGSLIKGSCDVQDREGSIEIRGLTHNLSIPTDPLSGRLTGTRKHAPFLFEKEIDSSSPYLYKAVATGQNLKKVEIRYYRINDAGLEVEYFKTEQDCVKVVSISPIVNDTRHCPGTGHLESIQLRYEKATWTYCDGNIQFSDAWNERVSA
ncbi:Hcp family type VI secretion system effector [Enterobacter roggenkampii]|uniref:Hcp family type VI secretion system effector n=1 Tax=Enterobacter roggenkampii TaxID=1812935 RepID=UPI001D0913E1|nr:type VI secretion system tube protein Hcp [Enterobacter roggenkampii]